MSVHVLCVFHTQIRLTWLPKHGVHAPPDAGTLITVHQNSFGLLAREIHSSKVLSLVCPYALLIHVTPPSPSHFRESRHPFHHFPRPVASFAEQMRVILLGQSANCSFLRGSLFRVHGGDVLQLDTLNLESQHFLQALRMALLLIYRWVICLELQIAKFERAFCVKKFF